MSETQEIVFPRLSREQLLWIVGSLLLAGWLVWLLAPVLTPFLISALLAYMADPLVSRLQRWMRRDLAVALVFLLVTALLVVTLLLIIPVLIRETADLFNRLPAYFEQLQDRFQPILEEHLGWQFDRETFDATRVRELLEENFANIAAAGQATWTYISESGGRFVIWITGLFLVPLVTFYLMRDWHRLLDVLRDLLPRNIEPTVVGLIRDCDEALGGFLRGQLLVMLSLGTIYAVGLWLVGLNNGIAIGMIAGLVSFVPYLGAITGVLLAGVTAVIQNFEFWFLFWVAAVFTIGQLIESFLLTPNLVGDRIGMHPVLVVFTVLAGGQLFGFIGVLLALPVAAAGTVLVRFFYRGYKQSRIYAEQSADSSREEARD
ncbi:MAG: AI-2E family transporter [Wenzhouxiangella sp.]|nr:MAG: AI-2E family transporter [Wenzhouxiangella sp.]